MQQDSKIYVGLDTSKLKISVAVAEPGRDGEVRFVGDIDSAPEAVERLVTRLAKRHRELAFCYEAGPTGYGLYRQITGIGHACTVAGPEAGWGDGHFLGIVRVLDRVCAKAKLTDVTPHVLRHYLPPPTMSGSFDPEL